MKIEWDKKKNILNVKKHGLSFDEAKEVFNDPQLLEFFDAAHSSAEEDRYIGLGSIRGILVVVVVFHDRKGRIRIISARKANQREREVYFEHIRRTN